MAWLAVGEELQRTEDELVGALTQLLAVHPQVAVVDPERAARLVVWTLEASVHRADGAGWL